MALAQAQTQSNIATAQTQAALNNINTFSPYGSSVYTPTTNAAGQTSYTLNQTLSPALQALFNQQTGLAGNIGTAAGGFLGQGANIGSLGAALAGQGAGFAGGLTPRPDLTGVRNVPYLTPGSFQTAVTTGAGGQPLPTTQTGVTAPGNIQTSVGAPGPVQGFLTPPGQIQSVVASNFPQLVQQAQDVAYQQQTQYLNPQFNQARQQIVQALADQGLQPGTEAYDRAMGDFNRQQQQAYGNAQLQAVQAGNAMQNQLFGQSVAAGQFANQAQAQQYAQALASGQFANQAQAQQYLQAIQGGQFANQAEAQQYAQALQSGEFANQAQQQMFGQGFQLANLYNQSVLGAAQQNATAAPVNLNIAQTGWQDPYSAMQALITGGGGLFGAGVGTIGAAMPATNAMPTWPISIPTMGGAPSTVQPTQYGALTTAAAQQNALANLATRQQWGDIGSLGGALLTGQPGIGGIGNALFGGSGGLMGATGTTGGLFGSLFGSGGATASAADAAALGFPGAAGAPIASLTNAVMALAL